MNFIKLRLEGHLGKDPELRYTPSGKAVCTFSVAFNPGKKDEKKPPVWFNCKAWNTLAEGIAANYKKGQGIKIANAFLDVEIWKDREGNEKSKQVWIVMELIEETTKPKLEEVERQAKFDAIPKESFGSESDIAEEDLPF